MNGATYKRCGCRQADGRKRGAECPDLSKRSHGSWYFKVELPPAPDGRRQLKRRGGFTTHREAAAALADLVDRRNKRTYVDAGSLTVGEYLDTWLAGKANLALTTRRSYEEHVRLYLRPVLGRIRLGDLTVEHLDRLYAALRQLGAPAGQARPSLELSAMLTARGQSPERALSAARVRRVHATLRSALNAAVKRRLVAFNPALHVDLEQGRRPRAVVWTPERVAEWRRAQDALGTAKVEWDEAVRLRAGEAAAAARLEQARATARPPAVAVWTAELTGAFLDYAAGDRLYALYHLMAFRGLRRGEAVGLRWENVALERGELTIGAQILQLGYETAVGLPKSGSEGVVALDRATVGVLELHREQQERDQAERVAGRRASSGLVFTREDGSALHPEYVSRHFGVLARQAGLPPVRLHDLRHGAATLALAGGADLKVVSAMLRHSSVSITADTYTSVLPEVARQAAEAAVALVPRGIPRAASTGTRLRPGPTSVPPGP